MTYFLLAVVVVEGVLAAAFTRVVRCALRRNKSASRQFSSYHPFESRNTGEPLFTDAELHAWLEDTHPNKETERSDPW